MSLVNLSLDHGRTQEDARNRLESVVRQVQSRFGLLIQRTEWTTDRNAVTLAGAGFEARMQVDPQKVHVSVDVPALASLLRGPLIESIKGALEQSFQKRLPREGPGDR